jgi:hypothetical protein
VVTLVLACSGATEQVLPSKVPLRVTIVKARGLPDYLQPYCVSEIQGKPQSIFKTRVIRDCMEPVWIETAEVNEYAEGDPIGFTVYSRDGREGFRKTDKVHGRASLPSSQFHQDGFVGELPLVSKQGEATGAHLQVKIELVHEVIPPSFKLRLTAKNELPLARGPVTLRPPQQPEQPQVSPEASGSMGAGSPSSGIASRALFHASSADATASVGGALPRRGEEVGRGRGERTAGGEDIEDKVAQRFRDINMELCLQARLQVHAELGRLLQPQHGGDRQGGRLQNRKRPASARQAPTTSDSPMEPCARPGAETDASRRTASACGRGRQQQACGGKAVEDSEEAVPAGPLAGTAELLQMLRSGESRSWSRTERRRLLNSLQKTSRLPVAFSGSI